MEKAKTYAKGSKVIKAIKAKGDEQKENTKYYGISKVFRYWLNIY